MRRWSLAVPHSAPSSCEKISGTFTGGVDPKDARNAIIQDLQLAPLNERVEVCQVRRWHAIPRRNAT